MRQQFLFEEDDIARLIVEEVKRRGYAVSLEDISSVTTFPISILVADEQRVSAEHPLPPSAPTPLVTSPRAPTAAPVVPSLPTSPNAWTSRPKDGSDGRFNLVDPPTMSPRNTKVRELGSQTGLLTRLGLPENPEDAGASGAGSFLDRYMDEGEDE